ncbi:MAG: hypothetical protein LBU73_03555 [Helicobacteraceae bacterium]|jgi:hypothetical protein|nr:hypothetical protein [Helicobacteraceae bacterium]
MATKEKVVVTAIDQETIDALNEEEQNSIKLLNIAEGESPAQIVEKIKLFVDEILAKNYKKEQLKEFAIALGVLWGKMV